MHGLSVNWKVIRLACSASIAALLLALTAGASEAVTPPNPATDPFYTFPSSLAHIAPGTVLRERPADLTLLGGVQTPLRTEQLLFRTTDESGTAALAVTTVIHPLTISVDPRIVSWEIPYDTFGSQCDPSYVLAGGGTTVDSGAEAYYDSCAFESQYQETLTNVFLAQGITVIITDYEETKDEYNAGQLEGYATLDGIRAAESYLGLQQRSTRTGVLGYSGGATAAQWAAELAPSYAPGLDLVGTAAGGVMVDPAHNLAYVNGNGTGLASVIPAFFLLAQRAFGIDLGPYLSPLGAQVIAGDEQQDLNDFSVNFTRYQQLLAPQYPLVGNIPGFTQMLNTLIMGSEGTPDTPMFLANGEGTHNNGYDGDDVMITADVEALAYKYCSKGIPVEFQEIKGIDHSDSDDLFIPEAVAYLTARLVGLPAPSDCASIPVGDSIAPAG